MNWQQSIQQILTKHQSIMKSPYKILGFKNGESTVVAENVWASSLEHAQVVAKNMVTMGEIESGYDDYVAIVQSPLSR